MVGAVWESSEQMSDATLPTLFPAGRRESLRVSDDTRLPGAARRTGRARCLAGRLALGEVLVVAATTAAALATGALTSLQALLVVVAWAGARLVVLVRRGSRTLAAVDVVGVLETGLVVLAAHAVVAAAVEDGAVLRPVTAVTTGLVVGTLLVAGVVALLHGRTRVLVLQDAALPASAGPSPAPGVRVVAAGVLDVGTGAAVGTDDDGRIVPLEQTIRRHRVDAVVVDPTLRLAPAAVRALSWQLDRTHTPAVVAGGPVASRRIGVGRLGGRTVLTVAPPRPSAAVRGVKGGLDRVVALLALLAVLPVLVLLGVLVRCDSAGPALFRQVRVGRDGRPFVMLKLRTMTTDAEVVKLTLSDLNEADTMLFKIRADPRVTRVGAWLRRFSLDELPQLWNVVRGEMSLVGPRPALPDEVARYDGAARRRLAVKPGLTGLWQVSGRSDLDWADALELDVTYIDNHSLAGDLAICARTVPAVVQAKGAY